VLIIPYSSCLCSSFHSGSWRSSSYTQEACVHHSTQVAGVQHPTYVGDKDTRVTPPAKTQPPQFSWCLFLPHSHTCCISGSCSRNSQFPPFPILVQSQSLQSPHQKYSPSPIFFSCIKMSLNVPLKSVDR
jgi:hypothetical protein